MNTDPTPSPDKLAEKAETPRTAKALKATQGLFRVAAESNGFADHARQLERELTQLRAENNEMRRLLAEIKEHHADGLYIVASQEKELGDLRQQLTHLKAELERANAEIAAWNDLYSNGPTAAQITQHLNPKKTP